MKFVIGFVKVCFKGIVSRRTIKRTIHLVNEIVGSSDVFPSVLIGMVIPEIDIVLNKVVIVFDWFVAR